MEHRHNKRVGVSLPLDVLIYRLGQAVATGKIRNLSTNGVFIETYYQVDMGKHYIEFALDSDDGKKPDEHRIKGLIIHRSPDGFGVMTIDTESQSVLVAQVLNTP